jgi:hypothetical protein
VLNREGAKNATSSHHRSHRSLKHKDHKERKEATKTIASSQFKAIAPSQVNAEAQRDIAFLSHRSRLQR